MMLTHELKCENPYFTDIWQGLKDFEIRKNDRNFRTGDIVILNEIESERKRKIYAEIKYIAYDHDSFDGLKKGYCVLGLKITNRAGHK
jgi:ParB family transcriptional regulator, chromosome partitioning protein